MSGSSGSGSFIEQNSLEARAEAGISQLDFYVGGRSQWSWETLSSPDDDRYVLAYQNGARTIIGTFYPDDESGAVCYQVMHNLYEQSERRYLHVPRPIAYLHAHQLLFTEPAVGKVCENIVLRPQLDLMARAGTALRELHALGKGTGAIKKMKDHVRELIRPQPEKLAQALPGFGDVILETLGDLLKIDHGPVTEPVLLHRDYQLSQLYDDGAKISIIEWDLSAMGDAAFDLGYFTAHLKIHYPDSEASEGISAFLEAYAPDTDILDRVEMYERFNFLRYACRQYRLKEGGWSKNLRVMLGRLSEV